MNAVWMVHERQLAGKLRFWTAIVGYDPRDHSLNHRLYLVYIILFFSLWGFGVLALLADPGALLLSFFEGIPPGQAAIYIIAGILLLDFLWRGVRYTRRSPFIFSDEDAGLICQTPVDRRQVAIAWMLGDWLTSILPYLVLVVVLCFALIQLNAGGDLEWGRLPIYWLSGFRVSSIVILMHLGLSAVNYSLGAARLNNERDIPALRLVPIGVSVSLVSLFLASHDTFQSIMWPVLFPLAAGYGGASWLAGILIAGIMTAVGIFMLYIASPRLNLSRAAQESRFKWDNQQARWFGEPPLKKQLQIQKRLGSGHSPTPVSGKAGAWALIWKDWIISQRTVNIGQVGEWMAVFITSTGIFIAPTNGIRIWSFIIWVLLIIQRCVARFRSDLELWVISNQLPFSKRQFVIVEIARPVIIAVCLSWLGSGLSCLLGYSPHGVVLLLIPGLILIIALMALIDIFRHCRSSDLLSGRAADVGAGGTALILLISGIPLLLAAWMINMPDKGRYWLLSVIVMLSYYGIVYFLWRISAAQFANIK